MLKKTLFSFFIAVLLIITGCTNNTSSQSPTQETQWPTIGPVVGDPRPGEIIAADEMPSVFDNINEFIEWIGRAKFQEPLSGRQGFRDFNGFKNIDRHYESVLGSEELFLSQIVVKKEYVMYFYGDDTNFSWKREMSPQVAMNDLRGRGEISYNEIEVSGISYVILGFASGYYVCWVEDETPFTASLPVSFSDDDLYAFCSAVPVTSWELSGDAVSVSVQGVEDIFFVDGEENEIIEDDGNLYWGENRIGYRWLIDEETSRYQYVLEPGEYMFNASGVGENPGLLVKHFIAGECVSEADFEELFTGQAVSGFKLIVTPDPEETELLITLPPVVF